MTDSSAGGAPAALDIIQEHFEQLNAIFSAHGRKPDAQAMAYMAPLLEGKQDLAQHREMLLSMLDRLEE